MRDLPQQQGITITRYFYGASRIGERTPTSVAYHLINALSSVRQLTDGRGALTWCGATSRMARC